MKSKCHASFSAICHILFISILLSLSSCLGPLGVQKDRKTTEVYDSTTAYPFTVYPFQTSAEKVWDLMHTDLSLTLDFDSSSVEGYATLTLKPHFYPQDSLILDAVNMQISEVLTHVEPLKSSGKNENLFVPPPTRLRLDRKSTRLNSSHT